MLAMLIAASLAIEIPSMPATDAAARAAVTVYIEQCERDWALAAVQVNREALQRCLADDYCGFSSRGTLTDKAKQLAPYVPEGKAAGLYYALPRFITPALAVVQGEEWWEPKNGSGKKHLIWTDVWVLRAGEWRIVASQDSTVPFEQPLLN